MAVQQVTAPVPVSIEAAGDALPLVFVEPRLAFRAASLQCRRARDAGDAAAESRAERALGLASKELNEMPAAVSHLRRAVAVAEHAGLSVPAAEARMSLALVLTLQGDTSEGLREAERAGRSLDGLAAARLDMQLALIHQHLGRFNEALEGYRRALVVFRQEGDLLWEAKLLNNRGVAKAYRGQPRAAEVDFVRSEQLYAGLGQDLAVADVRWNRGFAAGRAGAVTEALNHFAVAERYYREHDVPRAALLQDQCQVLISAGLRREARTAAECAVAELARRRMFTDLAEARLMLARVALADRDPAAASTAARLARRAFERQHRPAWAVLATHVGISAAWAAGLLTSALLHATIRCADQLAVHGWTADALDARLIAARIALALDVPTVAQEQLVAASAARRHGQIALRIRAWHAEALLRQLRGDLRGARTALLAGLRALDWYRSTLGATDLRVHVAVHGEELASIGLALALRHGADARSLLAWAERSRARALLLPPVRPPDDADLATDLAALRALAVERDQAAANAGDVYRLTRRLTVLERSVQQRLRRVPAPPGCRPTTPSLSQLSAALGDRGLVEFVEWNGELVAVVLAAGRATKHRLSGVAPTTTEIRALRYGLTRLTGRHGSTQSRDAARAAVARAAENLDRWLLGPLRRRVGDRDLLVVPTGVLHLVPWSLLSSCDGRPVAIAPSALTWLRAQQSGLLEPAGAGTVFVAGPGLPAARTEVRTLAATYPHARCLVDDAATVAQTMAGMDGAACAHLAAHGHFRGDNPQFSSLVLSDGPLTVYDLESLTRAPDLVVLPACNSGVPSVHSGDEVTGMAAALLALGTRALVACVVPVGDAATAELMLALHRGLCGGLPPAAALAAAQTATGGHDAAGFLCYGAG